MSLVVMRTSREAAFFVYAMAYLIPQTKLARSANIKMQIRIGRLYLTEKPWKLRSGKSIEQMGDFVSRPML
jgi:hypothetical protein